MSGIRVSLAAAVAVMGVALANCSAMPSMPDWAPDWIQSKPSGAQMQPLRFESEPAGAEVRTTSGQTCLTPCAVGVPSEPQAVTITKIGFIPQTIQVSTGEPPPHSFWESPPPTLVPNPVQVVLQPVPPPPRSIHRRRPPPGSASRTRTAATPPRSASAPPPPGAGAFPPPPGQ